MRRWSSGSASVGAGGGRRWVAGRRGGGVGVGTALGIETLERERERRYVCVWGWM